MRARAAAVCAVLLLAAARVDAADIQNLKLSLPGGGELLYGILVPDSYQAGTPTPLLLALHPGGERFRYYGSAFTREIVAPAAAPLGAIIVAPDCPTGSWTDPAADAAVMTLIAQVMRDFTIERSRVLVLGYSMGGRGTWFMVSQHRDLFTGAIPIAASTGGEPAASLPAIPTYIIHSRRDEVVPFGPAERNARELERLGRTVKFEVLTEPTHFQMGAYVPAIRRAVTWMIEQWNR